MWLDIRFVIRANTRFIFRAHPAIDGGGDPVQASPRRIAEINTSNKFLHPCPIKGLRLA
jgi:hypothetical protein